MSPPTPSYWLCALLGLMVALGPKTSGDSSIAQSKEDSPSSGQKAGDTAGLTILCPDSLKTEGCTYLKGLYDARDKNVSRQYGAGSIEFLCFREGTDQFFSVHLSRQHELDVTKTSQDQQAINKNINTDMGDITAFAPDVGDASLAPQLHFKGKWIGELYFVAKEINTQSVSGYAGHGITVDPQQLNASWRYMNPAGVIVDYRLSIQLSIGSFSEAFTRHPNSLPSLVYRGRCSPLPVPPSDKTAARR